MRIGLSQDLWSGHRQIVSDWSRVIRMSNSSRVADFWVNNYDAEVFELLKLISAELSRTAKLLQYRHEEIDNDSYISSPTAQRV